MWPFFFAFNALGLHDEFNIARRAKLSTEREIRAKMKGANGAFFNNISKKIYELLITKLRGILNKILLQIIVKTDQILLFNQLLRLQRFCRHLFEISLSVKLILCR